MMRKCLYLLLLLAAANAYAANYKWTDAQGKVHYTDTPPPKGIEAKTIAAAPSGQPGNTGNADDGTSNLPAPNTLTNLNQNTRAEYERYLRLTGSRVFLMCQDGSVSTVQGATDEAVNKILQQQQSEFQRRGCQLFARNNKLAR